jgi:hypothetical protein
LTRVPNSLHAPWFDSLLIHTYPVLKLIFRLTSRFLSLLFQ